MLNSSFRGDGTFRPFWGSAENWCFCFPWGILCKEQRTSRAGSFHRYYINFRDCHCSCANLPLLSGWWDRYGLWLLHQEFWTSETLRKWHCECIWGSSKGWGSHRKKSWYQICVISDKEGRDGKRDRYVYIKERRKRFTAADSRAEPQISKPGSFTRLLESWWPQAYQEKELPREDF